MGGIAEAVGLHKKDLCAAELLMGMIGNPSDLMTDLEFLIVL